MPVSAVAQPAGSLGLKTKIRIAIADDHPVFREGLRILLSLEEDFDVVAQADDGFQVSTILEQCKPDILLLDLKMPRCGGLAVLERLQKASSATRVILLTASDDESDYIQALRLGSYGIVQKHASAEFLINAIRKVHAGLLWIDTQTTTAVMRHFVSASGAPPVSLQGRRDQRPGPLSGREREITHLITQGFTNAEIATMLSIKEQTTKNHLYAIFNKLGVTDRLELALYAVEHGITGAPTD